MMRKSLKSQLLDATSEDVHNISRVLYVTNDTESRLQCSKPATTAGLHPTLQYSTKTRAGDERRRPKVRKEEKERNTNRKYWGGLTLFLSWAERRKKEREEGQADKVKGEKKGGRLGEEGCYELLNPVCQPRQENQSPSWLKENTD